MTNNEFEEAILRAQEEITMWREYYLGKAQSESEKSMHFFFKAIPSDDMVKKGIEACYKESVKAFLIFQENRTNK